MILMLTYMLNVHQLPDVRKNFERMHIRLHFIDDWPSTAF